MNYIHQVERKKRANIALYQMDLVISKYLPRSQPYSVKRCQHVIVSSARFRGPQVATK